jgi:hypothetical protein
MHYKIAKTPLSKMASSTVRTTPPLVSPLSLALKPKIKIKKTGQKKLKFRFPRDIHRY